MSRPSYLGLAGLTAILLLLPLRPAFSQAPPAAQVGVEVLARGPIHEAFAQPVNVQPEPGPMAPKQPPPLLDEVPPDQKPQGDNIEWIPGYWQWDDEKNEFIWISGFWRQPPPGRTWVPGQFQQTPNGWQWVPGYWSAGDGRQTDLLPQPPPPVDAVPATPAPGDDSIYVPGAWVYRDARYRWRPAFCLAYQPGWVWQPAQYLWTPNGYVCVDGYWDYSLDQRGLLFAPVAIDPALLTAPNWYYTPSYVVNSDFLPSALFVRPGWQHYYFGDYFGPAYARNGYTPWQNVRLGAGGYDPLYGYSRRAAGNRGWERDLNSLYAGRQSGNLVLPPRTWNQQQALLRKINVDKSVQVANLNHVTPLTPLSQLNKKTARLQTTAPRNFNASPGSAVRSPVTAAPPTGRAIATPSPSGIAIKNGGVAPAPGIAIKNGGVAAAPKMTKIASAPAPKMEVRQKPAAAPARHVAALANHAPARGHVGNSAPAHGHSSGHNK